MVLSLSVREALHGTDVRRPEECTRNPILSGQNMLSSLKQIRAAAKLIYQWCIAGKEREEDKSRTVTRPQGGRQPRNLVLNLMFLQMMLFAQGRTPARPKRTKRIA
jgi:hypothetical protein